MAVTKQTYFCITPEREEKTTRIMASLAPGWGEAARLVKGRPPDDGNPFAVWGHLWLALDIVPPAVRSHRPFWFIDNGFWKAAARNPGGYYRISYRGIGPILMRKPDMARGAVSGATMNPWRKFGRHVVIATQSTKFGKPVGINAGDWINRIEARVRRHTDRPVIVRPKATVRSLSQDLRDCWALVTHSSNAAVEAAAQGIPVFVEKESAAAPIGNLDLADLEKPKTPDGREHWWASLLNQQFSLDEMRDGTAYRYLSRVREQVDG